MSSSASFPNPQPKASQEMQHLQQLFATSLNKDSGSISYNNSSITQRSNKTINIQPPIQNNYLNSTLNNASKPYMNMNHENNQFQIQDVVESSSFPGTNSGSNQQDQPPLSLEISDLKEFLMEAPGLNQAPNYSDNSYNRSTSTQENIRLLIYLEQPLNNYIFNKNDLVYIFNNFSQHISITIFNERPAAEVIFTSRSAANDAIKELDKIHLGQIGLLRCVILNNNQAAQSLVQAHLTDRQHTSYSMDNQGKFNEQTMNEEYRVSHPDEIKPGVEQKSQLHKKHSDVPPQPLKKIGWLELIDVFSFEPHFDITEQILGTDKDNMNYILKQTNEKIGLNIQGKPVDSAPFEERLHLVIFSSDLEAYYKAIRLVEELLMLIMDELRKFAKKNNSTLPQSAGFCRHEYEEDSEGRHYLGVIFDSRISENHTAPANNPYQASSRRSHSPQYRRQGASDSRRERDRRHENYGNSSSNTNVKPLTTRNNSPYGRSSPQRIGGHVGGSKRANDSTQQMRFNYNRGAAGMH